MCHLTVARVAEGLGVGWDTANDAVLAEGRRVPIDDDTRFDGVRILGVDEHALDRCRRRIQQIIHGHRGYASSSRSAGR